MMRPFYSILPLGLIIIVAIGIYALHFVNAPQIGTWHDDAEYVTLGESFAVGQPYRLINYPDAPLERVYPPGYPLFILAPAWLIGSGNLELLRASSLLLAIANIVLLFFLARRHMQGWQLYLTVALFAWHPAIAAMAVSVMSETAFLFFVLCYLLTVQFACQANEPVSGRRLVLAAVLLAVATLIRYQGIALILGSIVWLICLRRWWSAVLLAGFVFIIISPFLLFLYGNGVNSVWSMTFIANYFVDQIPSLSRDVVVTLANFWHALGFAVWPLIGPRLIRLLSSAGLWWIVAVVNTAILALVSFNLLRQTKNKQLHGIFLCLYALISVLVADRTHGNSILDEYRYVSLVLPFIYLGLVESLGLLASFKPLMPSVARAAPIAVATILLSTLLWRNGLDIASQSLFSIVDLRACLESRT